MVPATATLAVLEEQHIPNKKKTLQDPSRLQLIAGASNSTALTYNATYDDLTRPAQGPVNPFKPNGVGNGLKRKNVPTGHAQEAAISEATFTAQHRTFQSLGYSRDPSRPDAFVGNLDNAAQYGGRDFVQMKPSKEVSAALRRKRQKRGDSSIVEGEGAYLGPWAKYENDDQVYEEEEAAGEDYELASDEEFVEEDEKLLPPSELPAMATDYQEDASQAESTEFHGSEQFDYLGRTYMYVWGKCLDRIIIFLLTFFLLLQARSTRSRHRSQKGTWKHQKLYPQETGSYLEITHETYHIPAFLPQHWPFTAVICC